MRRGKRLDITKKEAAYVLGQSKDFVTSGDIDEHLQVENLLVRLIGSATFIHDDPQQQEELVHGDFNEKFTGSGESKNGYRKGKMYGLREFILKLQNINSYFEQWKS